MARSFVAWIRRTQPWLALAAASPVHLGSRIIDVERSVRLPETRGYGGVVFRPMPTTGVVGQRLIQDVISKVEVGTNVDLPEALLDDARHFRTTTLEEGAQIAILLAAVACEVKVKTVLRLVAPDDKRPLVELLIARPRDFTVAAHALFTDVMEAACSRSLHAENGDLSKRVQTLYETRNKIAHRGHTPSA